jgi:group I intron endonuclease
MYGVIYKIQNLINGNFYIGQTKMRLMSRWSKHKQDAANGKPWPMSAAIRKYGVDAFEITVLQTCANKEELNQAEIKFIAELKPSYNCCAGGGGLGSPTPEVRAKMSAANKGKRISEETRARMSAAQKGHPVSPETVAKIQKALRPRYEKMRAESAGKVRKRKKYVSKFAPIYEALGITSKLEKISTIAKIKFATGERKKMTGAENSMFGKQHTADAKRRISEALIAEKNPFFGKSHTLETRQKMQLAHKQRPKVTCPVCNKVGHLNAMKRWHFDKCRSKT